MEDRLNPRLKMVQTGIITIPYWLTILALILPLAPLFIIFFRKAFLHESLTYLMILCLFLFIEQLMIRLPQFSSTDPGLILPAFRLGEFAILFLLFRATLQHSLLKELLSYFLISFVSVVVTIFINKGLDAYHRNIDIAENFIIVLLSILVLLQLIRNQYMFIFQSPVFWIAGGSLCFYLMSLLIEFMTENGMFTGSEKENEKAILLLGFSIARLIFYIIAAAIKQYKKDDDGWMFLPTGDRKEID